MSAGWFARTLASAQTAAASLKENVREGTSIRTNLGAALTSVAEAANDRVRRLHARVTGRQSFEDAVRSRRYARAPAPRPRSRASRRVVVIARRNGPSDEPRALTSPTPTADPQVARVERAARECPPSERPAMLRRWLAVLRAQQDDPARPASPSSSASASTAPDHPSDPEPDPDPETDWDALTLAADESGDAARAGADQDASHGVDLGVDPSDARDPTRLVFSAADADASSTTYSAPGFEPDRETNHDTRIATVSFRFRDVLIRSRALERLVEAYARRPAASTVESALLLELFRATTMDDAVADALGDGLRRAAAAVAARDAEVQLRDEDFVGMLVAAAASVKLEGEAETLRVAKGTLDAELERAAEDVARATTHARERSDASEDDVTVGPTMGIESRQRSGSNAAEVVADSDGAAASRDVTTATSRDTITTKTPRDTSTAPPSAAPPPTAALASATRRALSLARRAFAAASTRREKIRQSAGIEPTASADALRRLRAASETLAVAKRDVAALSEESRARLLEAETFADAKSADLRARARTRDARTPNSTPNARRWRRDWRS